MKEAHYETLFTTEENHWWYRVRRKIVTDLISKYSQQEIKIVDIGCGTGRLMLDLQRLGQVFGMDASQKAIEFCRSRGITNLQLGDITRLPYEENEFDVVLCLDVLEHTEDDIQAIKEIKRIAKPGGLIIIFVPAFPFLWGVSDIVSNHFRRYTAKEMISKIEKENLHIVEDSYFNSILFLPIFITRKVVNLFKIPLKSENNLNTGLVNKILFYIFNFEATLLKIIKLPFGVSYLMVLRKQPHE